MEIQVPLVNKGQGIPAPLGRIGEALRLLPAIIGGEPGSNGDHIRWREKSLGL